MDISSAGWLSELGMDDPTFIHQCQMNSFTPQQMTEDFQDSFSSESYSSYQTFTTNAFRGSSMETSQAGFERPTKQMNTNIQNSSPYLFTYGNLDTSMSPQQVYVKPGDEVVSPRNETVLPSDALTCHASITGQGVSTMIKTPPSHARDHIIAERKRRENLNQRFIALSAIVPGLKKMDKASVLGGTISYLKQLKDQVKALEEQTVKKTVESVFFVKKSQLSADDDTSSSDENSHGHPNKPLPEMEARVSDKNVLIRIHCEKRKGLLVKALTEIEKLDLTIVSSSVIPFGSSAIDITIIAQMDDRFCMTVKDLVRNLQSAFGQFMRKEEDPSYVHV